MTTPEWQDKKNDFIKKYNALAKITSEETKIIPYRVIELNWNKGLGPKCFFIDRKAQNIPLINDCLSRFVIIPQQSS